MRRQILLILSLDRTAGTNISKIQIQRSRQQPGKQQLLSSRPCLSLMYFRVCKTNFSCKKCKPLVLWYKDQMMQFNVHYNKLFKCMLCFKCDFTIFYCVISYLYFVNCYHFVVKLVTNAPIA